jgi:hypothetical protein
MVVHGYFRLKWGLCGHLSSTRGPYTSPHICFLAIDHILGFLVETIVGTFSQLQGEPTRVNSDVNRVLAQDGNNSVHLASHGHCAGYL